MLCKTTDTCESHAEIQQYVMAAIVEACEVYTEQKWLTWADHWIAGRDRSFASAMATYRIVRQVCDRELAEMAGGARDGAADDETDFGPAETPAEIAAWAAGLALVMAPMSLNPAAGIRRIEFALRSRLSRIGTAKDAQTRRPSLAGRAVALARRAAAMLSPSEVSETARL
jgi:hypothetical protein